MTDVNVQYFSHLNGLSLGNNWGDLINLLDVCLVNGLPFSSITSATISELGDINLTLSTAHNAMLFQLVELSGFSPSTLNKKYRIKGVPSTTQLILKADLSNTIISAVGNAKLASLGYDLAFTAQGKRVYRAKNPNAQHPFIRVDETLSDGSNTYNQSYAKYAMVGLIENMTHIDDYEDPTKLQLPLDTTDLKKNWKITGTGTDVIRGWSRWYYARSAELYNPSADTITPTTNSRAFTLVGDSDAFYFCPAVASSAGFKQVLGCGLYHSNEQSMGQEWFLMTLPSLYSASTSFDATALNAGWSLNYRPLCSKFLVNKRNYLTNKTSHTLAMPLYPYALNTSTNVIETLDSYKSGRNSFTANPSMIEIPFIDDDKNLRGTLKHVCFICGRLDLNNAMTTPIIQDKSMYVIDGSTVSNGNTGVMAYYLGDIE